MHAENISELEFIFIYRRSSSKYNCTVLLLVFATSEGLVQMIYVYMFFVCVSKYLTSLNK